jgi:lysophospholipase L1-like esterase
MRIFPLVLALGIVSQIQLNAEDAGAASSVFVRADSPQVLYEGRTLATPDGRIRMGFPGIVIHLRFKGGSLGLRLDAAKPEEYIDLSVDGARPHWVALSQGIADYTLVADGGGAEHRVDVTRRTESWQGECDVLGLTLGAGSVLLPADPLPSRKMMFIGDSITCGECAAAGEGDPPKDNRLSSPRQSYGMILARRFNAQCSLVSYGGRGLIRDWQGITATVNAPQFYGLALPDDPGSTWDPRRYVPDAIGICIGQNDFNLGVPDQAQFVDAYVRFVRRVLADAPKARIVLITSPILNDWPGQVPARTVQFRYLQQVVSMVNSPQVTAVEVSHQPGRPGNGHPTGPQHEAMANELEPAFRAALGW